MHQGIDQEKAEDMLGAHWNDQDYDGIEDESYRGKVRSKMERLL